MVNCWMLDGRYLWRRVEDVDIPLGVLVLVIAHILNRVTIEGIVLVEVIDQVDNMVIKTKNDMLSKIK